MESDIFFDSSSYLKLPEPYGTHIFGFSREVVEKQSSFLTGPAEDVVEKWPWLKTAEYDLSYTLFRAQKKPRRRCCCKKGLKRPEEGAKTGSMQGV